ncbi:class I lanthipeptide [Corallibacter sp.]|uniref:class I lanthipeptide n=1 Tax=Corallibacter sp. TaxID=2038084 RepID=UPI003A90B9C9
MKTQAKKLDFTKSSIVELNDQNLNKVTGGTGSIQVAVTSFVPTERPITYCLIEN